MGNLCLEEVAWSLESGNPGMLASDCLMAEQERTEPCKARSSQTACTHEGADHLCTGGLLCGRLITHVLQVVASPDCANPSYPSQVPNRVSRYSGLDSCSANTGCKRETESGTREVRGEKRHRGDSCGSSSVRLKQACKIPYSDAL